MRHHAIIVTSWKDDLLTAAHAEARRAFPHVSEILPSIVNHYGTFLIPPDGSKEGWQTSDEGDHRRDAFVAWLDQQRDEDGGSALDWAEVFYGDDDGESIVVRHTDAPVAAHENT